jgi:hypothetical protein
MTAAPFGEVVEFWGCITAHWRLPLGSCLKLRSSLTYGLHLPSIDRPRNRAGKFYRALLRRLAQAVAGDPFAVRVVVRNPGHSRRARVLLSSARRAPRHRGNRCDAHHKAGEHYRKRTYVQVRSSCGCIHHPAARVARRMVDLPLYTLSSRSISIASIFRF